MNTEISLRDCSRLIAIFLMLTMLGGWFGELYVPSRIITADAATTAAQLRDHAVLFRLGFAAYLAEAVSDLVLAWLFYILLRPIHRDLALLSAFFGIVSMCLFAVTQIFYFSAPLFLSGRKYLTAFSPEQLAALARLFVGLYGSLAGLFASFYGAAWIIRGFLAYRSGYLPRLLGALMAVAGLGFVAQNIMKIFAPTVPSDLLQAPMFLNVVALAIWLLVKGVDTRTQQP
jgi:Domain of unknown function (DUF4386)